MNFFAEQDRARQSSRRLVFLYVLSTALIVAGVSLVVAFALYSGGYSTQQVSPIEFLRQQAPIIIGTAVVTTLFIIGATLVKTAQLSAGGSKVAQQVGGTLVPAATTDPLRSRLRNIVEEMAIASGVPVPEIYVLERETSINAFAAGFAPGDAAIAVTRGALDMLDRDELQGVIAHEFSHILNGDMRLNIRLMGVLFGIMSLGLMGRMIFRGIRFGSMGSMGSKRGKGAPIVLILGLGLIVLGAIGVFFARMIKSGVSRQREYLADASAVQFTRQSTGLANALKKIGGYDEGSIIRTTDPEEISHMLFGSGSRFSGLFATHPPLTARIQALDPNFKESDYHAVSLRERDIRAPASDERHAGFEATGAMTESSASIGDTVGRPNEQHIAFAAHIRQSIPASLYDAAHSPELAYLLVIALLLDRKNRELNRQFSLLNERLGEQRTNVVQQFYEVLQASPPEYRLPLLEIAFPALRQRPPQQLTYLVDLTQRLIEIDGEIDLYEFCFYRILASNLRHSINPSQSRKSRKSSRKIVRDAAVELLRILAHYGHNDAQTGEAAFRAGLSKFGNWGDTCRYEDGDKLTMTTLDESLDVLVALNGAGRTMLLDAVTGVVMHDDQLTVAEAGLVRAICASLEIPLPPQISVSLNSGIKFGSD